MHFHVTCTNITNDLQKNYLEQMCVFLIFISKKKKRSSKRIQQKNRFASTFRDGDSRKVIRTLERAGANGSSLDTRENYRI